MSSINQNLERLNHFNKSLEEYKTFGDSSSDEIVKKWKEFNQADLLHKRIEHNDYQSFITHAVAIKFLYSTEIQKAYNAKRRNIVILEPNFDYDILEKSISGTAERIVARSKCSQYSEVRKVISDTIYNDLQGFFKAIQDKQLKDFFLYLIHPHGFGYDLSDLVGCSSRFELGNLQMHWKRTSLDFSIVESENRNFAIEFYSNLRLLNKLEKMRIKYGDLGEICSKWKYSENASVEVLCHIKKFEETIYKSVKVLFDRETLAYAKIYDKIYRESSGRFHLRSFTGDLSQLSPCEASLHFLLFGAEVMRNPSALIHNMMLLDLIKNGELSWEEVFKDGIIPMDMEHSERASRIINDEYNKFMPHEYSFDIPFDKYSEGFSYKNTEDFCKAASTILEKGSKLIDKWLRMKLGDEFHESPRSFYDILKTACQEWFQVDIN